jgi:hypothetical protein
MVMAAAPTFAAHRATTVELSSILEHSSGIAAAGGLLMRTECWRATISDRDPSWAFLELVGGSETCGDGALVVHEEGSSWREAEGIGGPETPCSAAMRVPQAISEELATCVRPPSRFRARPTRRTSCPTVVFEGPPEVAVYVLRASCTEAGIAAKPRSFYEQGLVEELVKSSATGEVRRYLPLNRRVSVRGYWEGQRSDWECRATRHRVLESHGPFADVQFWIACGRRNQRVEVRLLFRPTLA